MSFNCENQLPPKVAIYIRVSTQFQVDKDSLNVQRRELIAYSEIILGIHDYEVFEDPGYSGKNTERPAYQRMLYRLRSGEFSHLLVWKIDRISRNLLDFTEMYLELKRLGIAFVSKNEQFDTSSAMGEAMLKIILVFAELERKITAERVSSVMLSRANNGQWNGGRIPLGYNWNKITKSFSINEIEADLVRKIYDLYDEKQSLIRVCDALNASGYRTKSGNLWQPVAVSLILKNVFYTGKYRYNVHSGGRGIEKKSSSEWIDIDNHHPALIDEERFNHFQFLLKRNRRNGFHEGDTYTRKAVHIFAGLLKCGNCGSNMTATQDKRRSDGWRPSIYGCSKHRKHFGFCQNKYISDVLLAPFIFGVLATIINASNDTATLSEIENKILELGTIREISGLDALLDSIRHGSNPMLYTAPINKSPDTSSSELLILRNQLQKNESSLKRLQSLYLYGESGISEKDYIIERTRIISEIEDLEKRISDLNIDSTTVSDDEFIANASYFIMVDKLLNFNSESAETIVRSIDPSVPKDFVNRVLTRITVTNGCVTEITFKGGITIQFIYK